VPDHSLVLVKLLLQLVACLLDLFQSLLQLLPLHMRWGSVVLSVPGGGAVQGNVSIMNTLDMPFGRVRHEALP
jgi:hypothetical protein